MTFEDIKRVNETLRTTDIKGKQYAEVNERIKAFRMLYPEGFIITEMLSNENGVCVFRTNVGFYDENGEPKTLGTGTAYEKEGSTFINKTSYIENCETSSVGRAMAMIGLGIDTSVASYEEVATAIKNQETTKMASARQCQYIRDNTTTEQLNAILKQKKVEKLEDLTDEQAGNICIKLNERRVKEMEV